MSPGAISRVAACSRGCGSKVRYLRNPERGELVVEPAGDDTGDVVLVRGYAYPIDSSGRVPDGRVPPPDSQRFATHRCRGTDAAAKLAASNRALLGNSAIGPCGWCRQPHERYGPNGQPLCAECRSRPSSGQAIKR